MPARKGHGKTAAGSLGRAKRKTAGAARPAPKRPAGSRAREKTARAKSLRRAPGSKPKLAKPARSARAASQLSRWIPTQPSGSIFDPAAIAAAIAALSERDNRLALLLKRFPPEPRQRPANLFHNLCRTVCAQMLSNAAANTIFARIEGLCERRITPAAVAVLPDQALREAGLSGAKVASVRAIADYFAQDGNLFARLEQAGDEEVERTLLGLRGLGPWSAEMFMLFSLGRMDIYSARDAALATGLIKLKRLARDTERARLDTLAARYAPYRSVVSLALWQWRHHDWEKLTD